VGVQVVLSYSRKAYSETVCVRLPITSSAAWRTRSGTSVAFHGHRDRQPAGSSHAADWYEPELNPKVREFAHHYGTAILPTRPRRPEHKGKVESSVKYVKNNALKGRVFDSVGEENKFLLQWEDAIADKRIHGTIRQQVAKLFEVNVLLCTRCHPCCSHASRRGVAECIGTAS